MASQMNISGSTSGNYIKLDYQLLDVWSKEILFSAEPVLRFESVFQVQTELQTTPGQTIKFLKYAALTGKSELAETATIETATLSSSMISISVQEHAKAVSVGELLLRTSTDMVLERAAQALGRHYAAQRDRLCRDTLLTSPNVIYSQRGGVATDRAGLVAGSLFDVDTVRDIAEAMATKKAPKFGGDAYVCFIHPHQARSIKKDDAWTNVQDYASPENMLTGELGRIDDVRFVQTTNVTLIKKGTQNIWADGADTGDDTAIAANSVTDVYQAIVVGDYAAGLAEALPVEMRDNGVEDFGRRHAIAYYGIWGTGLIESNHVFVVETA